jgi:hypothetical protein
MSLPRLLSEFATKPHEILADWIIHALGVVGGLVAVIVLLALAAPMVSP